MSGSVLSGPTPSFTKTVTGYRSAQTLMGDTLERIAQREMGDATRWHDLANLNGLAPPWISDSPISVDVGTVLLAGQDTVLIPSTAPIASGVSETPNVYGRDCLLLNGKISPSISGDVAVVAGVANLKQALEMRLGTHQGELVYHPSYGCRAYKLLGQGGTPLADQLAASWVAAAIRADPRVSSTSNVNASTSGDILAASGEAISIAGQRLPLGLSGGAGH